MITVFTPTYNRANFLPNLYKSLQDQNNKNFEWIIVDDGSVDCTEQLVSEWLNDNNDFNILYFKQKNSGKHIAINKGVQLSKSDWFFIVDSDDFLVSNAIDLIEKWVKSDLRNDCAGVSGTRINSKGVIIGDSFKFDSVYLECKNNERKKYGLLGDKAEVYKTSVLKSHPFPKFDNEVFLSECAVWDQLAAEGYSLRWYKNPLIVCDYLSNGLTSNEKKLEIENFQGFTYSTLVRLKVSKGFDYYRVLSQYIIRAANKKLSLYDISTLTKSNIVTIFFLFCLIKVLKRNN